MRTLTNLLTELQLLIISHLSPPSKHIFSLTSKQIHGLIGPINLTHSETYQLRYPIEQADPGLYSRLCRRCLRFFPFYHFPLGESTYMFPPAFSETRICGDCDAKELVSTMTTSYYCFFRVWAMVCRYCRRMNYCRDMSRLIRISFSVRI